MIWVVLWTVLVLVAGAVLAVLGQSVYRKSRLLIAESAGIAERLAAVTEGLQKAADTDSDPDLAVFADPGALRRQRFLAARARTRRRSGGRHRAAEPRPSLSRTRLQRTT